MKPLKPVPVVNVANVLTVARLVLVPVFVVLLFPSGMAHSGWRLAACAVFVLASVTDFVDGWVARSRNLVTAFGKVADPIADKALTGTALVLLSLYDRLPWWVTVTILVREWGVTGLRFWVLRHGMIPVSRGGKVKTALQVLAIGWYLCPFPEMLALAGPWLMGAAVIVTVVTGVDYVMQAFRLRRAAVAGGSGAMVGVPAAAEAPARQADAEPDPAQGEPPAAAGGPVGRTGGEPPSLYPAADQQLPMLTGPSPAPAVASQTDEPVA